MTIKKFLKTKKNRKTYVIFSMLKDKDCLGFLTNISGEIDQLVALAIPSETKSFEACDINKIAKKIGINSRTAENFDDAFSKILALQKSNEEVTILICGSLYLAGSFLEIN
jgi:dihydrofolate synthase/folylpolyglutamate synthase